MQQEIRKILITAALSTLLAVIQAYLVHLTGTSVPAAIPAMAGANGLAIAALHALQKLV